MRAFKWDDNGQNVSPQAQDKPSIETLCYAGKRLNERLDERLEGAWAA
jgi:hypothetical protein